nr:DUF1003 domain-containing protein [Luteipulveratus mongoliensis]
MGSWPFVFVFLMAMAVWAWFNSDDGFDPYPFILLNLFLSMVAGLQGAILLISAKRADSISSEVALHTLANTARLQQLIQTNTDLTLRVSQLSAEIRDHIIAGDTTAQQQASEGASRAPAAAIKNGQVVGSPPRA